MGGVSRPVEIDEVARHLAEFGDRALLVSVGDDQRPHVVTVVIEAVDVRLATRVGGRTSANVSARPGVTLTWPAPPGGEYVLLVDGTAELAGDPADGGGAVTIRAEHAILHRLAGLAEPGPSCVTL